MRFGKQEITALLLIVCVVIAVSVYAFHKKSAITQQNSDAGKALLGSENQLAEYTDLEGNPISLEDYNGRYRVVNSWATWCPYCKDELKDFSDVASQFNEKEVVFITINRGERKEKVKTFIERFGAAEHLVHVLNPNDSFYNAIGGSAMPETVFYDTDGSIVHHVRGALKKEDILKITESLLQTGSN